MYHKVALMKKYMIERNSYFLKNSQAIYGGYWVPYPDGSKWADYKTAKFMADLCKGTVFEVEE